MLKYTLEQVLAKSKGVISSLHPVVALAATALVEESYRQNVMIRLTHGYRSYAEQTALYNQGRYGNPGPVVTNAKAGYSNHNFGTAIDFVLLDGLYDMTVDKDNDGQKDWMEVVTIAKMLGFAWGGDWKSFKDNPHLEMTFGLTTAQWRNGTRPSESVLTAAKNKINTLVKSWKGELTDDMSKEIEALTAQLKELAAENVTMQNTVTDMNKRLEKLEKLHNYPTPPEWSHEAIKAAKALAKENGGSITTDGSSYDFLRFLQVLYVTGLTKPKETNTDS